VADEHPDLVTGVYIDAQSRKWFCVRRPSAMNCSSSDYCYTSAYLDTFKRWGWKLTKDQTY
jgi:hypothetical protein